MTLSEFADWFREHQPRSGPICALWKDIVFGTRNQVFWYADSKFRVQIDLKQGGAITDLRPYASELRTPCGAGTRANQDASYPYIVQSRYRAGAFTHYAGEGAIKSCKVRYQGQEVDLSACRTSGAYREEGETRVLDVAPVEVEFRDLTIRLATCYRFEPNSGRIEIARKLVHSSNPAATVEVDEFLTSCWGTTEYPEDLTGCLLVLRGRDGAYKELRYDYRCRAATQPDAALVLAEIPQVQTRVSLAALVDGCTGYFEEGYSFAPNLKIGLVKSIALNEELSTCLKVERAR